MNREQKYELSYSDKYEGINTKLRRLETIETRTYDEILKSENIEPVEEPLYHGLRFDPINKLESIFIDKYILPSREITKEYYSMDGTVHRLIYTSDYLENCNKGKYVSLMPYCDDIEFDEFIRRTIFLVIRGDIPARETLYLKYDDYIILRKEKIKTKNLYSYAYNEYMINKVPLSEVLYIGIDSYRFDTLRCDKRTAIKQVIELLKFYELDIPFYDIATHKVLYQKEGKKLFL